MDEPHPDAVPDQRERVRPRKDKGIALEDRNFVSEDLPLPGWNPGFTPGDGSGTSEAPLPDDFFANLPPGITTPASLDEASKREVVAEGSRLINKGMRVFNSTLDGSFREACLSHFKAEEIERKFFRFQNEVAERERRQAESHSRALIRAERKGRRTIASDLARRATLFDAEFRSFKDAQDYVGDFHECRGSVGSLWKSGLMDGCAQAESMVPPFEGRIRVLGTYRGFGGHDGSGSRCCRRGRRSRSARGLIWSLDVRSVAVCYLSELWPCKELVFVQGLLGRPKGTKKSKTRKGKEAAGASGQIGVDGTNPTQVLPTQEGLVNNETGEPLVPILPTEVQVADLDNQHELRRAEEAESSHAGDQAGHGTGVEEVAEPSMREVLDAVKTMGTLMLALTRAFTPLANSSVGQVTPAQTTAQAARRIAQTAGTAAQVVQTAA
ncbi:hypothetical protein F2Q70_00039025 [Brassica cretica]|uniref:Uncharacterized protein n=1 Tax=Brassica cretica TaxID=69181 RepID=A0A8S9K8B4_BRACR|nr:hypothetical protein F2Q70_00039025 [Brassica cretica]